MANNKKIIGDLESFLKTLLDKRETPYAIAKQIGVSKDTVKKYLIDNNLPIYDRTEKRKQDYQGFLSECQNNPNFSIIRKKYGISFNKAKELLKKNNIKIRNRQEVASQQKVLSIEEAQSRLPSQSDRVVGFENGKYRVETQDGFVYFKSSAKLSQGDPRGKRGFAKTEKNAAIFLKDLGYEYISDFQTTKKPLNAKCKTCKNIRSNRLANFEKQNCATCSNIGVSKAEYAIREWITSFGLTTEKYRFTGKTKGKEIDIYIPSLNLGIEYCGLYWHNENSPHPRLQTYHYDKMKQCEDQGIRLITIFEDEWVYRQAQVKNFLKSVLNVHSKKIFARKCIIREVEKDVARQFLDKNHIQGTALFEVAIGLYHQNELVGLITGNTHHRQKNTDVFVLNRLVFLDGIQVVGGASKLLKYLINYAKLNGFIKLISWSDNRWSQGNVYKKCGFTLEEELKPDYSYVTPNLTRQSKQLNKKTLLIKKGALGDMSATEKQLASTLGYHRIWDCGKKRWTIELK